MSQFRDLGHKIFYIHIKQNIYLFCKSYYIVILFIIYILKF